MWTATTAFVYRETFCSASRGSKVSDSSISAMIGTAPSATTAHAGAIHV